MAFTNDNGQSCSAVTLTRIGLGQHQALGHGMEKIEESMSFAPPTIAASTISDSKSDVESGSTSSPVTDGSAPTTSAEPVSLPNCSWVAKWVNGSKPPFATLSLRQTGRGNDSQPLSPPIQGTCTAIASSASRATLGAVAGNRTTSGGTGGAVAGEATAGEACTVLRAACIPQPGPNSRQYTVVQVTMRTAGRLVALTGSLCHGGACGMVQWIDGEGNAGQLTLLPLELPNCHNP